MSRNYLFWGPEGSGKSKAALDGRFPVSHYEWEPGGFRRAATHLNYNETDIEVRRFRVPATELEQMGEIKVLKKENQDGKVIKESVMPGVTYRLDGWVQVVAEFHGQFMADTKEGRRGVFDSVTRVWLAERMAYEEQYQKQVGKDNIETIGQLKFTSPNARMTSLMEYSERYDLDLVMISHARAVWQSSPTVYEPDCPKEALNLADVVMQFAMGPNSIPQATFKKAGEEAGLLNKVMVAPTLERIDQAIVGAGVFRKAGLALPNDMNIILQAKLYLECRAKLESEGIPVPEDAEGVLAQGRMLGVGK